jgi:hypothetical protein
MASPGRRAGRRPAWRLKPASVSDDCIETLPQPVPARRCLEPISTTASISSDLTVRYRRPSPDDPGWNPNHRCSSRHVYQNHRVRAYLRRIAHPDTTQHLGASADIDVTANLRRAPSSATRADRDLLEYQAVRPNDGVGVNNNPIGMRNQQSPPYRHVQGNIRSRDGRPESVRQKVPLPSNHGNWPLALGKALIAPDGSQQLAARIPVP